MRLSIVTAVLNSHEIVRRQLLHYGSLPDDVELIFVDDGSNPPLTGNVKIIQTNDTRNWTEHIARNKGAKEASGDYIFFIDIDYVVPFETILKCLGFKGDRKPIRRQFGILTKEGTISTEAKDLKEFGLKDRWIRKKYFPGHRSQFLIKKSLFWDMGGYNESLDGVWRITGGAGERFWRKWQKLEIEGKVMLDNDPLDVYMFPSGKFADFELPLFHGLKH